MQLKYNSLQSKLSIYEKKIKKHKESISDYKNQLQERETTRRVLHNELQDLRGNIRVFCRIKPDTNAQFKIGEINKINPDESINDDDDESFDRFDRAQLQIEPPENNNINSSPMKKNNANGNKMIFEFDKIFDEKSTNNEVFEEVSQLVQSSLDGYKVCIFAYGQTGSGKTYTMLNPEDGIIPSTLKHIYSWVDDLKSLGWEYKMRIQFVEIYNDSINDLLTFVKNKAIKSKINNKKIEIRHQNGSTMLTNVEHVDITNMNNVDDLLKKAMALRSTHSTKENDHSSRSHSVFTIFLEGLNHTSKETSNGVLNLIDLAGSERLNKSQATGDRLKETQHINKSLSCLGDVIHSLSSNTSKTAHVPFRNSKLTYMLQNYLTGEGKTLMFVNVSSKSYFETLNSLRFSSKVNNTKMR